MIAKKLFEELGYTQTKNTDNILLYEQHAGLYEAVIFDKERKIVTTLWNSLGMQELKAINQQVKELGWIEKPTSE